MSLHHASGRQQDLHFASDISFRYLVSSGASHSALILLADGTFFGNLFSLHIWRLLMDGWCMLQFIFSGLLNKADKGRALLEQQRVKLHREFM